MSRSTAASRDDWAGNDVYVLPGTYEFDVEYAQMSSSFLFAGPIQAGMDVARAVEAGETRRRIRFRVEVGRSAVWDPPAPVLAPAQSPPQHTALAKERHFKS